MMKKRLRKKKLKILKNVFLLKRNLLQLGLILMDYMK
jgi:hypothetical protein